MILVDQGHIYSQCPASAGSVGASWIDVASVGQCRGAGRRHDAASGPELVTLAIPLPCQPVAQMSCLRWRTMSAALKSRRLFQVMAF